MEQDFGSEYSSACESGWTLYLGYSMHPCDPLQNSKNYQEYDDNDDDNMSMVSDASSGPPHIQQQECNNSNGVTETCFHKKIQDYPSFLDCVGNGKSSVGDNVIADYSEGESRFQDQFSYVNSFVSSNQLQQNQSENHEKYEVL